LGISGSCCTGGFVAGIGGAAGRLLLAQLLLLLRPVIVLLRLALA